MRFLVVATPRLEIPRDEILGMIDAAEAWRERHADRITEFGIFPGGGGFGIIDAPDEGSLHRILVEMPFIAYSTTDVRVVVDGATGWRNLREAIAARLQQA
jgi:muconolactone delta-isomerase